MYRKEVRELVENQWRETATVVLLGEMAPEYRVPGRRTDGTVKGTRLVRRFLRNTLLVPIGAVVNIVLSIGGGGAANIFSRTGRITGTENSAGVTFADTCRTAHTPWLAFSQSHLALVDTGDPYTTPGEALPAKVLWQATAPALPRMSIANRTITWSDGSELRYHLSIEESRILKNSLGAT
ncbi:hypothetical protein V5P93_002254 [Actinokineospora auranticolor]|uniref:hypothetical protein n=1 Tax=Actinokineospora auranticolor TaxID=155976 RepID=UPI000CEC9CE5|nr:hypothetical protein [Actinokineospora auranticolor]